MADAAKSARGAFTDIKSGSSEMGGHVSSNMFASRHAIMAVSEAFGDTMPRAITALLVHIGPLGVALEAAFPFAAIGLAAVLLIQHLSKLREEGQKLTSDQIKFGTAAQTVFNSLDEKLIRAGIRSDELRNNHLGALRGELELIDRQSMAELVQQFGVVQKAADGVFADLKSHWYTFGIGATGAKHALDTFQDQYDSLLAQGKNSEASDLLKGTRESAEKVLGLQKTAGAKQLTATPAENPGMTTLVAAHEAVNALKKYGVGYDEKEVAAQEALVGALQAQATIQEKVAALKKADSSNAVTATGNEGSAKAAEAARAAAEHTQKMGELRIAAEREQDTASAVLHQASIAERLATDTALADKEYAVQQQGNAQLIAALDKAGKDYNNQLKALHEKAEEETQQHSNTVAALTAKASLEQYRKDLTDLEQSERQKIDETDKGSAARLAAIEAALKTEQSKQLQGTAFYRELLTQRTETIRQAAEEDAKLTAEAGKEAAASGQRIGELALAAQREHIQIMDTVQRLSDQQRLEQQLNAANAEYTIKATAMERDIAALNKGERDYENQHRALQDKQKQLIQQHENEITAIEEKAEADRLIQQRNAMSSMENTFAQGFLQVLQGHQSFASMMGHAEQQLTSNLLSAAVARMNGLDSDKLKTAESAARYGFNWGAQYGGPAAPVLAPAMAATFFAGVMAFADGTDMVPGVGRGDVVPAMLTPGEGVVPGGVMDGLRKMASSGSMGGGPHYHVTTHVSMSASALDSDGMDKVLSKHGDKLKHFESALRRMNH